MAHNAWVPLTIDPRSAASDPGNLKLSLARLKRLEPDLFLPWRERGLLQRRLAILGVREQLRLGDSRAALVISVRPLRVAAYTDEFDCSVVVELPAHVAADLELSVGTRLLAVHTYASSGPCAADLVPGPGHTQRQLNVFPLVAEFLVTDPSATAIRKQAISEQEWIRASAAADEYLRHTRGRCRDGRPTRSGIPVTF